MNKEEIIEGLNDKQKEAVLATEGPCLFKLFYRFKIDMSQIHWK